MTKLGVFDTVLQYQCMGIYRLALGMFIRPNLESADFDFASSFCSAPENQRQQPVSLQTEFRLRVTFEAIRKINIIALTTSVGR